MDILELRLDCSALRLSLKRRAHGDELQTAPASLKADASLYRPPYTITNP